MKYEKFAPGLLAAMTDFKKEGRRGLTRHTASMGLFGDEETPRPPRTVVFLHCEEDADLRSLSEMGIKVNQASGQVRTAYLPVELLESLSDNPGVKRIMPSQYLKLMMDVAPEKVKLPDYKKRYGLNGNGVIIGVVDSGIDPTHPAFSGRILRTWDQVLDGPGVAEGEYGLELTGALIAASRDKHGHGTHVAGIASGAEEPYQGVAPGADLVIVKTDMQDAHIADGVRYIFRIADELGRPAVVNLSLGGHWDAHDGTDSLSMILDNEAGPGRIVVCAAGNEGNDNIHAQVELAQDESKSIRFTIPATFNYYADSFAALNGWYSGSDQMEVAVQSPGGFQTPFQPVITTDNPAKYYQLPDGTIQIITPGPDPENDDHNFFIVISASEGSVTTGIWKLLLRSTNVEDGTVHIWSLGDDILFTGSSGVDSHKIGSPGSSGSAVTVASYTTKVKWQNVLGDEMEIGLALDDISDFSSEGPLREGSPKPDVAAPGAMITSCLSADSTRPKDYWVNEKYTVMCGTSMASPFITGVVALMLEKANNLEPSMVKDLLKTASQVPGQEPLTFDTKWGFGLLDFSKMEIQQGT